MAYIDKDKALNLDFRINVSLFESRRKTAERAVQAYADAISAIPAADVRPVVRGKWTLNKDGSGTCSECGFIQNSCWDLDNWDNFCHHCGADMREES